jgi:hypothetical protein
LRPTKRLTIQLQKFRIGRRKEQEMQKKKKSVKRRAG